MSKSCRRRGLDYKTISSNQRGESQIVVANLQNQKVDEMMYTDSIWKSWERNVNERVATVLPKGGGLRLLY